MEDVCCVQLGGRRQQRPPSPGGAAAGVGALRPTRGRLLLALSLTCPN